MARNGCYLYVQSHYVLLRLNLSDLLESGSSAEFEVAYDYAASDGRVPVGMTCIVVGSKIYMVGGEKAKKDSMLYYPDAENWLNTDDVYVFDHTKPESEDRLVPVRDGAVVGKLNGPKTGSRVITLEGKFYALSDRPLMACIDNPKCPFEVFDPTLPIPSWKVLPHQPKFPVTDYFAWGHKLLAFPEISIFDAKDEKWESGETFVRPFILDRSIPFPTDAAVEFKGVAFALAMDMNALVAYVFDASGQLNAHWVLDELSEVFVAPHIDEPYAGILTDLGGGRMCLLYTYNDYRRDWIIRVQIFQVYITTVGDSPDRPAVKREIMRTFKLPSWNNSAVIFSAFMCDHSNKSDIQADASSGLHSCEDLKKRAGHAIEYVKGDSKKPKTTLIALGDIAMEDPGLHCSGSSH